MIRAAAIEKELEQVNERTRKTTKIFVQLAENFLRKNLVFLIVSTQKDVFLHLKKRAIVNQEVISPRSANKHKCSSRSVLIRLKTKKCSSFPVRLHYLKVVGVHKPVVCFIDLIFQRVTQFTFIYSF